MTVCEQVIVDYHSRNVSLINCFSGWNVGHFPSDPQRFSVFSTLTNGSGGFMMKVAIASLEDFSTIYERIVPQVFRSPREEVRFHLRVTQCVFPRPGDYAVQLFIGNELITDTKLAIHQGTEMNECNSRDVRYVIADDDGTTTTLDPLEDPHAHSTPEQLAKLDAYLERTRKLYRRPAPPTVDSTGNELQ